MATLEETIVRVGHILQEERTTDPAQRALVIAQAIQESLTRLARLDAFGQIQWLQGIASQALYTLPTPTVSIAHVLYNSRVLRWATEDALDLRFHGFEALGNKDPLYWSNDNQPPNTIRLVPAPRRTGSTVPVVPAPLIMPLRDNLVVFCTEMPDIHPTLSSAQGELLPTLADQDDLLVWQTARMLAERETQDQNLPVAQVCQALETLWLRLLPLT